VRPLAKSHARAATILIDELNTGGLERAADSDLIGSCHGCLAVREFGATDGRDADRTSLGQIHGGPSD